MLTCPHQANCVGMLGSTLKALAEMPDSPELEEAMTACCYAMTELGQAGMGWDSSAVVQVENTYTNTRFEEEEEKMFFFFF